MRWLTILATAMGALAASACAAPLQSTRPAAPESSGLDAQVFKLQKDTARILAILDEMRAATKSSTAADPAAACAESAARSVEIERQVHVLEEQLLATQRKLDEALIELRAIRRSGPLDRELQAGIAPETSPTVSPTPANDVSRAGAESVPAPAAASGGAPEELFNAAYADFSRGSYPLALKGFTGALQADPGGPLAPTAQYYVGETLLAMERYADAVAAFDRVIAAYPTSDRVMTARLKRGLALFESRRTVEAVQALQELIDERPKSDEARIAREFLKRKGIVTE